MNQQSLNLSLKQLKKELLACSSWILERVLSLDIQMIDFIPLRGTPWIPLPKQLSDKKATIKIKNDDQECFKWCVTRALVSVEENDKRIDQNLRENSERINWAGLKFPTELSDILKFENLNANISINVFGFENVIYSLRLFKGPKREHEINQLLIADEDEEIKLVINKATFKTQRIKRNLFQMLECFPQ